MNFKKALILGLGMAAATCHAQLWTMTNSFAPTGVSGNGTTMVGQTASGWFYWTPGAGVVEIGGVTTGTAKISDDGMRIGGSMTGPANQWTTTGWTEMGIYDVASATWHNYGSFNYHSGTTASSAWGISGDGATVLGQAYYNTTGEGSTAARVNPTISSTPGGPPTNLDPNTVNNGRISASNFDGTVVGGYDRGTNPGAIWVNGAVQLLSADYSGTTVNLGVVEDISSDGRWVVGDGSSGTEFRPYLYDRTNETTKFAPNPWAANLERAVVTSVSADGTYVFGRYLKSGANPFVDAHLFVWNTQTDDVRLLNDIAAANNIDLQGLNLTLPSGMSDDGTTFVGMGAGATATQTFYLKVNPVPEPGTIVALCIGAGALFGRRRRKG